MSEAGRLEAVIEDARLNAAVSWLLVGFVAVVALGNFFAGNVLWAGFAGVLAVLGLVPAITHRSPKVMLPWEVLLLAALPLIGRTFATVALTSRLATYLSVAAIALVVAVELHLFTPVRMTSGFAVLFVVVTTMATAGVWAVSRWLLDITFGTHFILVPGVPEDMIENRLMWEFVWSTAAGVFGGLIFEGYFRRRSRAERRIPPPHEVGGR